MTSSSENSIREVASALGAAALAVAAATPASIAQEATSPDGSGVYTVEQASRGKVQYDSKCASCHGGAMAGIDVAPPLAGPRFLGNWSGLSVGDLATRVRATMPADEPGSLDSGTVADIVAYMFKANGLPAGNDELPGSQARLRTIRIEPKR